MKTTPSLNKLISDAIAFESHKEGKGVTVFTYEGDIDLALEGLNFNRQYFKETSTGRSLPSQMFFNEATEESVFLSVNKKQFTFSGSDYQPV